MRVSNRKISEVPDQVCFSKCFCCTLHRSGKIKHDTNDKKRQCVAIRHRIPGILKRHYKVCCSADHRNNHPSTPNNRHSLQPPGYVAENKMLSTTQGVRQYLCP